MYNACKTDSVLSPTLRMIYICLIHFTDSYYTHARILVYDELIIVICLTDSDAFRQTYFQSRRSYIISMHIDVIVTYRIIIKYYHKTCVEGDIYKYFFWATRDRLHVLKQALLINVYNWLN